MQAIAIRSIARVPVLLPPSTEASLRAVLALSQWLDATRDLEELCEVGTMSTSPTVAATVRPGVR